MLLERPSRRAKAYAGKPLAKVPATGALPHGVRRCAGRPMHLSSPVLEPRRKAEVHRKREHHLGHSRVHCKTPTGKVEGYAAGGGVYGLKLLCRAERKRTARDACHEPTRCPNKAVPGVLGVHAVLLRGQRGWCSCGVLAAEEPMQWAGWSFVPGMQVAGSSCSSCKPYRVRPGSPPLQPTIQQHVTQWLIQPCASDHASHCWGMHASAHRS